MKRGLFTLGTYIPASEPNFMRFKVLKKIIDDSEVFLCYDEQNNNEIVVKAEAIGERRYSRVEKEWNIYQKLSKSPDFDIVLEKVIAINHRLLVMKKKGIDLREYCLKQINAGLWTDESLHNCGIQMIKSLQKCHSLGFVHLDPKPNNFVLDANDENRITLIDFDLSKAYLNDKGEHIPFRKDLDQNQIVGNRAYLSINGHKGEEQSRRDDMIFLGYSLIWMARPNGLPWNGTKRAKFSKSNEFNEYLRDQKISFDNSLEELCVNRDQNVLHNLVQYMKYCTQLKFEEEPNYSFLISLFDGKKESHKTKESESYCL